jgi:hypothetical protein
MLRMGCRGDTSPMKWLTFVNLRFTMVNLLQLREMSNKNAVSAHFRFTNVNVLILQEGVFAPLLYRSASSGRSLNSSGY